MSRSGLFGAWLDAVLKQVNLVSLTGFDGPSSVKPWLSADVECWLGQLIRQTCHCCLIYALRTLSGLWNESDKQNLNPQKDGIRLPSPNVVATSGPNLTRPLYHRNLLASRCRVLRVSTALSDAAVWGSFLFRCPMAAKEEEEKVEVEEEKKEAQFGFRVLKLAFFSRADERNAAKNSWSSSAFRRRSKKRRWRRSGWQRRFLGLSPRR